MYSYMVFDPDLGIEIAAGFEKPLVSGAEVTINGKQYIVTKEIKDHDYIIEKQWF